MTVYFVQDTSVTGGSWIGSYTTTDATTATEAATTVTEAATTVTEEATTVTEPTVIIEATTMGP